MAEIDMIDAGSEEGILQELASALGLGTAAHVEEFHPETARKTNRRRFFRVDVEGRPVFMVKLPTSPSDAQPSQEVRNLRSLRGVSAPRALRSWDRGFVMDYVGVADFQDVFRARSPEARPALIDGVIDEIASFHSESIRTRPEDISQLELMYTGRADRTLLSPLHGTETEIGPAHGDLGPWNTRLDARDRPIFIDWEDYRDRGIPWLDALNFAFCLPLLCFSEKPTTKFDELFVDTFVRSTPSSRSVHRALSRYAARRNILLTDLVRWIPFFCEAMSNRVLAQGRTLDNMFYPTFQKRFSLSDVCWLDWSVS